MKKIILEPVAIVKNSRPEIEDDHWGDIISEIELLPHLPTESLDGIEAFSHLEIIYHFDQVPAHKIYAGNSYPRGNKKLAPVGIFAQRKKNRPNRLGATIVELVEHRERTLIVRKLDAIDGTPILDIKPVFEEFLPQGKVRQAAWSRELMKNYW